MAELSTIARPYAEGLMEALQERKASAEEMTRVLDAVAQLALVARDPQVNQLAGDPGLTEDQLYSVLDGMLDADQPAEVKNLLRVVVQNGRIDALPEIARQFRILKNRSEGVADAYIETAFPLTDDELKELLEALAKKFPGVKLHPAINLTRELQHFALHHVAQAVNTSNAVGQRDHGALCAKISGNAEAFDTLLQQFTDFTGIELHLTAPNFMR